MKILRIISTVDPQTGGPIEGIQRSSEALISLGHHIEIVTLDAPDSTWLSQFPYPVHALGPQTRVYGYSSRLRPWLQHNLRRFDAALVHGVWNYTTFAAWRALRKSKVTHCVFTHGSLDPWHRRAYPIKDLAKQLYWRLIQGPALKDARYVLFTTEEERRLARAAYPGHQEFSDRIIAYGTADAPAETPAQAHAFRQATGLSPGESYLLFLSRIHPKKGVDILLRAFARLHLSHNDLRLVIAGPEHADWGAELRALAAELGIADKIIWPGMLKGDAKWGAYRGALGFVLPSHGENFGIVIAEALACGTPVLTTRRVNTYGEVVAAGAGFATEDTEDGVHDMLAYFLGLSSEERDAMSRAGRDLFLRRFDISHSARDIIAALS